MQKGIHFNYADRLLEQLSDDTPEFQYFTECLFRFVYNRDLPLDEGLLVCSARNLFALLKKKDSTFIVDVQNSDCYPAFCIIGVVSNNMPFFVDSIIATIQRFGIEIHNYANSILCVERKGDGFIGFAESGHNPSHKCNSESFAVFIVDSISSSVCEKLTLDISSMLSALEICVNDWGSMLSATKRVVSQLLESSVKNKNEIISFLEWLIDNNFTFLGYVEQLPEGSISQPLGLRRLSNVRDLEQLSYADAGTISIYKSHVLPTIHKFAYMKCIRVQIEPCGVVYHIFGFFSSRVSFANVLEVPLISAKVKSVLEMIGFPKNGHDYKFLVSILQNVPKDEIFESSENDIFNLARLALSLVIERKVRVFARKCISGDSIECTIFVPISRMNFKVIEGVKSILKYELNCVVLHSLYQELQNAELALLNISLKPVNQQIQLSEERILALESKISSLTTKWSSALVQYARNVGVKHRYINSYAEAFPEGYRLDFSYQEALDDIQFLYSFLSDNGSSIRLYSMNGSNHANLKVVDIVSSGTQVRELPEILDALKRLRVKLVKHQTYDISLTTSQCGSVMLRMQHFVLNNAAKPISKKNVNKCVIDTLEAVFNKKMRSDYLNSLSIRAGVSQSEIFLTRAICSYLHQISPEYSEVVLQKAICKNSKIFKKFLRIFKIKFDPMLDLSDRLGDIKSASNDFTMALDKLPSYFEEKIFTMFLRLLNAMLRTNFYNMHDYISFKFDSTKVSDDLNSPAFREIFVYSASFEGAHIRSGKVARGGIRWSSRASDFRTEALDLVRAQVMKNSIIVPTGSKGCFITKRSANLCTNDYIVSVYMNFIKGLLELTDNISNDHIVPSANLVIYDDGDPYLVVAADKGTASFSDYANSISIEHEFWLADAFASGGRFGYNHKKMGITARGAFEALKRHFWEKSHLFSNKESFAVVGIGDMSGDLFGNGMLLSKNMRLIAAFNHKHIFIDPSPDIEASYNERQRLFNLPVSGWDDYDLTVISTGGGVLSRTVKKLDISKEIQDVLNIHQKTVSPEELIRAILKADVDVIWNGGIGTYIKGSSESDSVVSDHVNSALRINGNELRAKVFIEGGNLGCTQAGRVEFAMKGGCINTDFVDNSGGVVCSDFEVNMKVLLQTLIESNKLTLEERNLFLSRTEQDVSERVTKHISVETRNISLEIFLYENFLEKCERVLQYLGSEFAKSKNEVIKKISIFLPFKTSSFAELVTPPNVALLFSCFRMLLKNEITGAESIIDDNLRMEYMKKYFLNEINEKFSNSFLQHPLRNEITITCISNEIIENIGCTLIVRVLDQCSLNLPVFVDLYLKLNKMYEFDTLMRKIFALDLKIDKNEFFMLIKTVRNLFINGLIWAGRNYSTFMCINTRNSFNDISEVRKALLKQLPTPRDMYEMDFAIPNIDFDGYKSIADDLMHIGFSGIDMDILYIANETGCSYEEVIQKYYETREYLMIPLLYSEANKLSFRSQRYWDRVSICNTLDGVSDSCKSAVIYCLTNKCAFVDVLDRLCKVDFVIANCRSAVFDKSHLELMDVSKIALTAERINRLIAIVTGNKRCLI